MRIGAVALTLLVTLVGCAPTSSGVLKMGPDTYSVSTSALYAAGGPAGAKAAAYREAGAYCSGMGKEMLVLNEQQSGIATGPGGSDIVFRCLAAGDPELKRPVYRAAPNAVIEDRR